MKGIYRLADKNIRIISVYPDVHDMCKEYAVDSDSDFTVETNMEDIYREIKKAELLDLRNGIKRKHREQICEELAVYRKISETILDYDTFLFP